MTCIDYSPSGRFILFGNGENIVKIRDSRENKIIWEEKLPREIYSVKYLPNGKFFFVNSGNQILIYSSEGKYINSFKGHSTAIWSMDTDPGGKYLVSGCFAKYFRIWNIHDVQLIEKAGGHTKSVLAVCFNTEGNKIATGSLDKSIKIWSWPEKTIEQSFFAHAENIYDLEFNPSGNILASASRDKKIKLWDVATGKLIHILEGHTGSVFTISFSPNGHFLLSGSSSGNIKLWEVSTGRCIYTYTGHKAAVSGIHFHPGGNSFVSSSQDGSVRSWILSPRVITDYCCRTGIESELKDNLLFLPRKENESRQDYKKRLQQQEELRLELVNKYYKEYLNR